jgi:hypothetical protein
MTPADMMPYTQTPPVEDEQGFQLFNEFYGEASQPQQNQKPYGHFIMQWMLDRPEKTRLRPDELSVERVRRARGKVMIQVTDEQAEQIAPFFRGDTSASQ